MSADAWRVCPKCAETWDDKPDDLNDEYNQDGGFYTKLFREDYEIFMQPTGKLEIHYSGSCEKCHASIKIKQEIDFFTKLIIKKEIK